MNTAALHHGHYAAVLFIAVYVFTLGNAEAAAVAPIAGFVLHEHAQRAAQIAREKGVTVNELNWREGFTGWKRERYLDAGVPAVVSLMLWWGANLLKL